MTYHLLIEIHMTRPISPHLSIYKPQITSVFSILHRMTGVYMFVFLVLLALTLFICNRSNSFLNYSMIENISLLYYIVIIGVSVFTLCLSYHVCCGIRYLFWSCGIGVNLHSTKQSAVFITIATLLISCSSIYMFMT